MPREGWEWGDEDEWRNGAERKGAIPPSRGEIGLVLPPDGPPQISEGRVPTEKELIGMPAAIAVGVDRRRSRLLARLPFEAGRRGRARAARGALARVERRREAHVVGGEAPRGLIARVSMCSYAPEQEVAYAIG
jgi:hypothetical protein